MPDDLPSIPPRAFRLGRWVSLLMAVLPALGHRAGAQENPESLPQLRQQLRHNLLAAILPEKQTQREDLFSLEKQLASGGDFKGAIRAREQRLELEQEIAVIQQQLLHPPKMPSNDRLPEAVPLSVTEATLAQVRLDPADNALVGWTSAASATWQLPHLPPGGYDVFLRYTLNPGATPVLEFKESHYQLTATLEPATQETSEKQLGTLRIRDGNGPLVLHVKAVEPLDELRILGVSLRPAAH